MSFCRLIKGITPKIRIFFFFFFFLVLINSILLNRSCFWIKQIRNYLFPCVMTSRGLRDGEQSSTSYGDSVSSVISDYKKIKKIKIKNEGGVGGRVLLISLAENSCHLPWVGTAATRAALPVPFSTVCVVLCCLCCVSKQWCGCWCLGFNVRTDADAHGVRESALEIGYKKKSLTAPGTPTRLAFLLDTLSTELSPPL